MAKKVVKKRSGGGGLSLTSEDSIESGLFSSGPAVIKESIFAMFDYGGNAKPVPVWLIVYGRDGEDDYEQPYSLGKGWKVTDDGKTLKALAGQTGLPRSCNAIRHLVMPLEKALKKNKDVDVDLASGDPSVLDGLEVVLTRVAQEVRDIKGSKPRDESKGERTILEIEKVTGNEGDTTAATGAKKKAKKKADADDDEEEDQDDDADEEADDDDEGDAESDDDDEDEKPKRGAKKPAAKAKGKKKPAADDDDEGESDDDDADSDSDDDGDDDAPTEDAVEAVIDAVASGPVALSKLAARLAKVLKGNKNADAISDLATSKTFLKAYAKKGWTFDGKTIDSAE